MCLVNCNRLALYYMGPKNIPANGGCILVHLCLTLRGIQAYWYVHVLTSQFFIGSGQTTPAYTIMYHLSPPVVFIIVL